jgi:dTDP-4-dehydrorhamnose reductase
MKKILITGANGLLGQSLVRKFNKVFQIIGCDLGAFFVYQDEYTIEYFVLDQTNRNDVLKFFSSYQPDIIINAAAYTNVDGCESDRETCWNVNVKSIELMEEACKSFEPLFVHISTDYVFDGTSGSYRETDEPKALGYYGLTKLSSEKVVRNSNQEYIIARTMVLYGTGENIRPNFATWVVEQLRSGNEIKIVDDQIGNPTFVDDLSEGIYRLIDREEYGIFHICGNEVCNRYEFALKIAQIFGLDSTLIKKISTKDLVQKAPRPMNSSFNMDKLYNTIDWLPGKLDVSIQKFKAQMEL